VHDDQELPPGLHIRLDITTGKREARLNIPLDDENSKILAGMETEQAVVLVDQPQEADEQGSEASDEQVAMRDRVPQQAPVYQAAGKIVPPRGADGAVTDEGSFQYAKSILQTYKADDIAKDEATFQEALSSLLDLSHDIYYGVELLKDDKSLPSLVAAMQLRVPDTTVTAEHRRKAALTLANALQNNPTALKEARATWNRHVFGRTPTMTEESEWISDTSLMRHMLAILESETQSTASKASVSAINGLIKSDGLKETFLEQDGMGQLLQVFNRAGAEWDGTREKIVQLVMDNFLDEDMGAELGKWPKKEAATQQTCAKAKKTVDDCWEFHLENYMAKDGVGYTWLADFLKALKERRPVQHALEHEL
jgi:nucleotide exchange factor SIL1